MKKILSAVLFVLCNCVAAYCTKPCTGICGFKIGEKFNHPGILDKMVNKAGHVTYLTKDYKKFMDFDMVMVNTLKDGTIYHVTLITMLEPAKAAEYYSKVLAVLENHYSIDSKDKVKLDQQLYYPCMSYFFDDNMIIVSLEEKSLELSKIGLNLYSKKLRKLAEEEEKEAELKSVDTSALD